MFHSILVPVDGSGMAEQAIPLALSIACRAGAKLTLLQVVPLPRAPLLIEGVQLTVDEQVEMLQKHALGYLRSVEQRLQAAVSAKTNALRVAYDTAIGQVAPTIADYPVTHAADLIVMATHGHAGLSRSTLGSVTDKVLQLSRAPLIIVRPQAIGSVRFDQLPSLDRIMITLDGSELAEHVLPVATELGCLFQSELLLFRATVLPTVFYVSPELVELQTSFWESAEAEAQEYLETKASTLTALGARVRSLVLPAPVVGSICEVAEAADVDLIAMTTHGRSALSRTVYGSVTGRVVHGSTRPVLVIRPPMGEPL